MEHKTYFHTNNIDSVHIGDVSQGPNNGEATKNDEAQTVRIDRDLKKWASDIATAVANATDNAKYGVSSVIREAIIFYRHFYQHRNKLYKYREAVTALLDRLP